MNDSQEVLSSLLKAVQLGQTGIRSVLDQAMDPELSGILKSQLQELNGIESDTRALASQRGWELAELDQAVRFLSDRRNRRKLRTEDTNSAIAALLILGNTRIRIQGLRRLNRYPGNDPITMLSQKLTDCQRAAIHQLEPFV